MGAAIKYHTRTAVSTGGTVTLSYAHDPKGHASKVGIIACAVDSGTQTGSVRIYYGNDNNGIEIGNGTFTAADPTVRLDPEFVIYPGQTITAVFSNVTAGDVVGMFVGGH